MSFLGSGNEQYEGLPHNYMLVVLILTILLHVVGIIIMHMHVHIILSHICLGKKYACEKDIVEYL